MKTYLALGLLLLQTGCADIMETWATESSAFATIEEVLSSCGYPHPCLKAMACEGKIVRVKGYIDYDNVFDKEHYPQLPYEKFIICDRNGRSIEIWVDPAHSREVFRQIHERRRATEEMAYLEGTIVGVDMPIIGTCQRGIRINLIGAGKIFLR